VGGQPLKGERKNRTKLGVQGLGKKNQEAQTKARATMNRKREMPPVLRKDPGSGSHIGSADSMLTGAGGETDVTRKCVAGKVC